MNVLIAEDNSAHRELLEILVRSGEERSTVTTVGTGEEFVRHLSHQAFDVALLDFHLPDCTADEILPRVDDIPNRPPIIVVSSDGNSETIIAALRGGGRDFLPKNEAFNATGLVSRIRAVLRRQREQQQLIERQKDECISVLAGGLAHDFNNMLVGILGKAALVREEASKERRNEYCDAIIRTGERLADLARQLLAYARGGKYNPKPTDLREIVDDTLSMLKGVVSSRIQIRTFHAADLWPVHVDQSQMVQALLNLCLNGCDAMGREGTLSIFSENVSRTEQWIDDLGNSHRPGEYVHLVVGDTGCGIPDSVRGTMFEPYHSTKGDGRGLGLAAVKGIVRSHAGALNVKTDRGRGTAFHLFLPRHSAKSAAPILLVAAEPKPSAANILVVDDEPEVRDVVAEIVRSRGNAVSLADCGAKAIEMIRAATDLDLVILDMRLPDCSGVDVLRICRKERPDLRVVLCSGYERVTVMQDVLTEFEDVPFLSKPFLPSQLLKSIDDCLRNRR